MNNRHKQYIKSILDLQTVSVVQKVKALSESMLDALELNKMENVNLYAAAIQLVAMDSLEAES
jgi:hypothetical protein